MNTPAPLERWPEHVVALRDCRHYDEDLTAVLDRLMDDVGGWERFVKPGMRVLVKPNLLSDCAPERAVTTHPALLKAVVKRLKSRQVRVSVGDSPASAIRLANVWESTGVKAVCDALDVPLINFEQTGSRSLSRRGFVFQIANEVLDADVIVNLPKIKTHGLTVLTAGVKNLYGVLPGYQKTQRHREYPHPDRFGRYVRALVDVLPPVLTIADGVVGMHGEGPSNGAPVNLGFLAAASDPVSLDFALCRLLGIRPGKVPYLVDDAQEGWESRLRYAGTPGTEIAIPEFKLPRVSPLRWVPESLVRLLSPLVWVRPTFNSHCILCGRCVAACPMKAIELPTASTPATGEARKPLPELKPRLCIGCCCCHEVCPSNAVVMRQSPAMRLVGAFRGL